MGVYTIAPEANRAHVVARDGIPIDASPVRGTVQAIRAALSHRDLCDGDTVRILAGSYDMLSPFDSDPRVRGPWGDAVYQHPLWQPITRYEKVLVCRTVTIEGQVDSQGVPTTVLKGSANSDSWGFIFHNEAHITVRDLRLERGFSIVESFTSFEAENLHFDQCVRPIVVMLDDRLAYADVANGDFTITRASKIENCRFTNGKQAVSVMGGGLTIRHCEFETMANVSWFGNGIGPQVFAPATFFAPFLIGKHTRGTKLLDNTIKNTDGAPGPFSMIVQAFGGHVVDCEFSRNVGIDLNAHRGLIRAYVGWFGGPSSIEGLRVYQNTVSGPTSTKLARFSGFSQGAVKNCQVSENVLENVYSAVTPYPAVELDFDCQHNEVVDNDYRSSGFPRLDGDISDSCVLLNTGTSNNLVKESGKFPTGQGGTRSHVTDLGIGNRVVGQPANTVEKPAGIGLILADINTDKGVLYGTVD